jgi:hypothetical protein
MGHVPSVTNRIFIDQRGRVAEPIGLPKVKSLSRDRKNIHHQKPSREKEGT